MEMAIILRKSRAEESRGGRRGAGAGAGVEIKSE
jgi:hypothetical protein